MSGPRSGAYLLFTFLGGATFFFGPIISGILMVLAFVLLSELTKAWLLYLGLVFLFMVMYAPGGIASLIMMNLRALFLLGYRKNMKFEDLYAVDDSLLSDSVEHRFMKHWSRLRKLCSCFRSTRF